jgi:GH24 family phage-related lysozyme (muramidase)
MCYVLALFPWFCATGFLFCYDDKQDINHGGNMTSQQLNSTNDKKVAANILRHIAGEEGFQARPYIDPNGIQANIGYGHTIHFFTQKELEGSRGKTRQARDKYLLSILPKEKAGLVWDKEKAQQEIWRNFQTHRAIAKEWLSDYGMENDERLADQLGMLFYGSKGDNFRKGVSARHALEAKDANALSRVASMFGRTNEGKPDPVLAKRRAAERAYYEGNPLPERASAKASIDPSLSPTAVTRGLARGNRAGKSAGGTGGGGSVWDKFREEQSSGWTNDFAREIPQSPEDWAATTEEIVGQEGKRRANEVVWKVLGKEGPMPEDFDASIWARTFAPDRDGIYEDKPWDEKMFDRGIPRATAPVGDIWDKFKVDAEKGQADYNAGLANTDTKLP